MNPKDTLTAVSRFGCIELFKLKSLPDDGAIFEQAIRLPMLQIVALSGIPSTLTVKDMGISAVLKALGRFYQIQQIQNCFDAQKCHGAKYKLVLESDCPNCGSGNVKRERAYRSPWLLITCFACGEASEVDAEPPSEAMVKY